MSKGRFGVHGGQYMPETLMNAVIELEEAYNHYKSDPEFNRKLTELLNEYAGRPSRLYFAEKMTRDLGGAKIYLKREDLNHTGAHKINNVLGQALLAKKMGKNRLIADNLMIRPYVGVDLTHYTPLDSLTLRCGYLATFDRERGVTDWLVSHAFVADLTLEWRFLGLRNRFYYGTAAQPLYDRFAALLYQGEAYYTADWHDRLDIYGYIFRNSFVNCYASIGLYFTPGGQVGCRQLLTVRAYIDQDFKARHKSGKRIRNIF